MPDGRTTWRDVAADLKGAIERGDYQPGERLPSQAQLIKHYGVASQTVSNALASLRRDGVIRSLTGSGHYVRQRPPVIRSTRSRLSPEERAAGRGAFLTDAQLGGWVPRSDTDMRIEPASPEVASALDIETGSEVFVRDRQMFADDEPVQLATSYLPRDLTRDTPIEDDNPGPGGIYARLGDAGHPPVKFDEYVRIGRAAEHEADQLAIEPGAPVFRITRIAASADRPVEVNFIVLHGERFELFYTVE